MPVPKLTPLDVEKIVPNCRVIGSFKKGGQKIVYPCEIDGNTYALKFILLNDLNNEDFGPENTLSKFDEAKARAEREISIMKKLNSTNFVKIGIIDLCSISYENQNLLYYSEEWIEGEDVSNILKKDGTMDVKSTIQLARDITTAIDQLWSINNVHRDIKPQNIMRRLSDDSYVLLDLGMAFDLDEKSLTQCGFIPGTKIYLSPEQLDWKKKRDIDFRSDLFSLGVVMYQALTGQHPFYKVGMNDAELFDNILHNTPIAPQLYKPNIKKEVNDLILRLLNKSPNGRYRKCSLLINHLDTILQTLEV